MEKTTKANTFFLLAREESGVRLPFRNILSLLQSYKNKLYFPKEEGRTSDFVFLSREEKKTEFYYLSAMKPSPSLEWKGVSKGWCMGTSKGRSDLKVLSHVKILSREHRERERERNCSHKV